MTRMNKVIETERLYFRRFTMKDSGRLTYLLNDPDVVKYTSQPYPYTEELAKNWISRHNEGFLNDKLYNFALVLKEDDRIIGSIYLSHEVKDKRGMVGYSLGKEYWNKGYASEALMALIKYAFEKKGFHKLEARHFEDNIASGQVMKKAGMSIEGRLEDHIFIKGKYETLILYAIINKNNSLNIENNLDK